MNVEWQSGWIFRILCWLALWAFGLVSGGLLLFGKVGGGGAHRSNPRVFG